MNECAEWWFHPEAWRNHLVEQLTQLTGMRLAQYCEMDLKTIDAEPEYKAFAACGMFEGRDAEAFATGVQAYPNKLDFFLGSRRLLRTAKVGRAVAGIRKDVCSDRTWYRSAVYNEYRRVVRMNDHAMGIVALSPGRYAMLDANCVADDRLPTPRTREQLRLLLDLFAPMVGSRLASDGQRTLVGLSRQLVVTLEQLVTGLSEKEIATKMGLKLPTVHEYVGKIYRHFEVESRAELMAYFIARRPQHKRD